MPDLPLLRKHRFELIDQQLHTMPFHFAALMVEVKVRIVKSRVSKGVDDVCIKFADWEFVAPFVGQIDEQLRPIVADLFLKMQS